MSEEEMVFVNKTGRWFVWDPCGITCAIFTYLLLLYGVIVMFVVVVPAFPYFITWLNAFVLVFLVFLCIASHVKAMITNPGIVQRESVTEQEIIERNQQGENLKYCKKCRSIKPDRAHHCSTCEHCVRRMDHHCPWINNCVGEFNQKYFVLFTFYVMIASFHGLFTVAVFFFSCLSIEFEGCDAFLPGPLIFVLMILGLFEGFLFILFTCTMFWSQIYSICTDETGIESIKQEQREHISWKEALYEVFGSPCSFSWLNPFVPPPSLVMYLKHCTPMNV